MNHFSLRHKTHSLTSSFSRFSILLRSRNCNFAAEHDTSENGQKNVLDQVSKYIYSSSSTTTMLVIRVPCCVALTNLARHQRDRQISPGGIQKKSVTPLHSSTTQQWQYRERDTSVQPQITQLVTRGKSPSSYYYIAETTFGSDRSCCLSYIFFYISPITKK